MITNDMASSSLSIWLMRFSQARIDQMRTFSSLSLLFSLILLFVFGCSNKETVCSRNNNHNCQTNDMDISANVVSSETSDCLRIDCFPGNWRTLLVLFNDTLGLCERGDSDFYAGRGFRCGNCFVSEGLSQDEILYAKQMFLPTTFKEHIAPDSTESAIWTNNATSPVFVSASENENFSFFHENTFLWISTQPTNFCNRFLTANQHAMVVWFVTGSKIGGVHQGIPDAQLRPSRFLLLEPKGSEQH